VFATNLAELLGLANRPVAGLRSASCLSSPGVSRLRESMWVSLLCALIEAVASSW
jgi:hypothetical protein